MYVFGSLGYSRLNTFLLSQASLDKQIKELNLRIVDLETKTLSFNSSRPSNVNKRLESRIEELQSQLGRAAKGSLGLKTADKGAREAAMQLQESERQRSRLEEEVKSYEDRIETMRKSMDEMVGNILEVRIFCLTLSMQQSTEAELQLTKRRAEREAGDYRQKALKYEHLSVWQRLVSDVYSLSFPFLPYRIVSKEKSNAYGSG
jgi:myosin heavy chain 9/10/11/14